MSANSAALIAKAHCKLGQFLTESDYKLLMAKSNVSEIVSVLKNYPSFSDDFASVSTTSIRRKQTEEIIQKRIFRIYQRLKRFKQGTGDTFYDYPIKNAEIGQIIAACMYLNAGVRDLFILQYPVYLDSIICFDLMRLSQATSFSDVLQVLKDTPYYEVLKPLSEGLSGNAFPDIKDIEFALTSYFYQWLDLRLKKDFSGKQRDELKKCCMRAADYHNIRLCYRYKGLFKMSGEQVMKYRIPYHLNFSKADMEQLLIDSDREDILGLILKLKYFKGYTKDNCDFQLMIKQTNYNYYCSLIRISQYDSVVLFSLMGLLQTETENLITVIEGVRYSLPPSEIMSMLIV